MSGRLIAVVGPSGVGKDTVMEAMAEAEPRLGLVRRVITRPTGAGGEVFDGVTVPAFQAMAREGAFALSWAAHGLHYGIPVSVDAALGSGRDMLANLSRGVLGQARARFPGLRVIALSTDTATLARRLAGRGRESEEAILGRLSRAKPDLPNDLDVIRIDNSGALTDTVCAALGALYPVRA